MVAVAQDKASAATMWASRSAPRIAAVGDTVWLDAVLRPTLAESVPQVGAPAAWEAGLDGAGVAVAVLDTGIDATHPDLAGRVIASRDFTDTSPEALDDFGHGTHVAGIIAGSGAASDGRYRGVAPGASILNGRVCVDGFCSTSDVIAGMEWAAPQARVVNLSLGRPATDGTDPLTLAVDALSEEHGTLFVASGGNRGAAGQVGPPAAANRALAVASVTKADGMSPFSTRGPRFDGALKPDMAAPGSDIVSARVPGTTTGDSRPVDDHYTTASGTSMAAPHVAAAAAILAQAHPDWSGERIKTTLMTSSQRIAATIHEQGAGRLDIAHALEQPLHASAGSLSFGRIAWPHDGAAMTRTVTLSNDGDAPLALDLAVRVTDGQGAAAPEGMFTLDAAQITLAPGASRDVRVTLHPQLRTASLFGGWLEVTGGDAALHVPVAVEQEDDRVALTLQQRWRDGAPGRGASVFIIDTATGEMTWFLGLKDTSTSVVRLARGTYDIVAAIDEDAAEGGTAMIVEPDFQLDGPATLLLDAARAERVSVAVERADVAPPEIATAVVTKGRAAEWQFSLTHSGDGPSYVAPTKRVTSHDLIFLAYARVRPADGSAEFQYDLVFRNDEYVPSVTYRVRDRDLARVEATYHGQGTPVNAARENENYIEGVGWFEFDTAVELALPTRRTEYFTPGETVGWESTLIVFAPDESGGEVMLTERTFSAGVTWLHWNAAPVGPGFGPSERHDGVLQLRDEVYVDPALFSPGFPDQNSSTYHDSFTREVTLRRGDEVLGHHEGPEPVRWPLPPGRSRYTLEVSGRREVPWSSVAPRTDVTWSFETEPNDAAKKLPIMAVRVSGAVDDNSLAPAGVPYVLALQVQHHTGDAAVTRLELDVSYDGRTWHRAPVVRFGRIGFALLLHPWRSGGVSLRARAADAAGTTVEQTVTDAYRIGR